jgi:transposase-like protein
VNTRNGYRRREWDTRAGSIALAIPKLRQGSGITRLSKSQVGEMAKDLDAGGS